MRRACAILLLVGARAAGVAPAETLASAVPAEKKNPIDAVEITYGRVGLAVAAEARVTRTCRGTTTAAVSLRSMRCRPRLW